jgi:TP901 family phage tail tape measure protein
MNVSLAESAALTETLAESQLKGADAGTALRNILLRLSAPEALGREALYYMKEYGVNLETLKNRSIPLAERLKELTKISTDANAMTKIFGV